MVERAILRLTFRLFCLCSTLCLFDATMSERYYVESKEPFSLNRRVVLSPEESNHLVRVMRQQVGDEAVLFDGRGMECDAQIVSVQRDRAELLILRIRPAEPPAPMPLTIAVALPKGDRQKWMVEKLTELSAARIVPLATDYGVYKSDANVLARLRRQAVEAAKQCGRRWLPEILEERDIRGLDALPNLRNGDSEKPLRLFAHPVRDGQVGQRRLRDYVEGTISSTEGERSGKPSEILVAIGPTGGFSPVEVETALANGWKPLELGSNVLRTETAAIAVAAGVLLLSE